MVTGINYSEYYKTITNTELIEIVENPQEYYADAIEAAKQELDARKLSEPELTLAKENLNTLHAEKIKQQQALQKVGDSITTNVYTLLDTLNPVQSGIPSTEKSIRLIVIVFTSLFVYQTVRDFRVLKLFVEDFSAAPVVISLMIVEKLFLPVALFLFYKRRRIGWVFMTIYLFYTLLNIASFYYQSFSYIYIQPPSPVATILQVLFYGGALFVLFKNDMKVLYGIKKKPATIPAESTEGS